LGGSEGRSEPSLCQSFASFPVASRICPAQLSASSCARVDLTSRIG